MSSTTTPQEGDDARRCWYRVGETNEGFHMKPSLGNEIYDSVFTKKATTTGVVVTNTKARAFARKPTCTTMKVPPFNTTTKASPIRSRCRHFPRKKGMPNPLRLHALSLTPPRDVATIATPKPTKKPVV